MNRDKLDEIDNSNFKETEKGASGDFSPVDVVQKSEVVGHESSNGGGKDDESTAVTARKYSDIDKKEPEMTGLSKNQLKKLRKIQKWEQFKGIKRFETGKLDQMLGAFHSEIHKHPVCRAWQLHAQENLQQINVHP